MKAIFAVLSLLCFSSLLAAADVSCEPDSSISVKREVVTYDGPFQTIAEDPRATPGDPNHTVELKGLLFYPDGPVKDAPVIIYNHGHEQQRAIPLALRDYFVKRGFVFFAPLRRGHFYDEVIASTGIHGDLYIDKCLRTQTQAQNSNLPHLFCSSPFCRPEVSCSSQFKSNAVDVYYLRTQWVDVEAQVNFILNHPAINATGKLADPRRVAILGHSYGGSAIVFANEHEMGQNVAIDVCGGEKSWGGNNPFWKSDLSDAMKDQQRPIYMLQPKNARTLEPSKTLFGIATVQKYRSEASIFPEAPWDPVCADKDASCWDSEKKRVKPEWEQAHSTFIGQDSEVGKWGCSAIEFVNRHRLPVPDGTELN